MLKFLKQYKCLVFCYLYHTKLTSVERGVTCLDYPVVMVVLFSTQSTVCILRNNRHP